MRFRIFLASLCAATFGLVSIASSSTPDVGEKDNGLSIAEERYINLYEKAHKEFGSAQVGANLVDDGTGKYEPYQLPDSLVNEKAAILDRWLHPPAPVVSDTAESFSSEESYSTDASYTEAAPATSSSCTPLEGEAESPTDVNPTSGAAGCWQVLPSTAAAHGAACADVNAPSCLAAICASQGNSAWAASGATPC